MCPSDHGLVVVLWWFCLVLACVWCSPAYPLALICAETSPIAGLLPHAENRPWSAQRKRQSNHKSPLRNKSHASPPTQPQHIFVPHAPLPRPTSPFSHASSSTQSLTTHASSIPCQSAPPLAPHHHAHAHVAPPLLPHPPTPCPSRPASSSASSPRRLSCQRRKKRSLHRRPCRRRQDHHLRPRTSR